MCDTAKGDMSMTSPLPSISRGVATSTSRRRPHKSPRKIQTVLLEAGNDEGKSTNDFLMNES